MTEDPRYWEGYYGGGPKQERVLRHFSLSDRIRYYWAKPEAVHAVDRLLERLGDRRIPPPLAHQYLPGFDLDADRPLTARGAIHAAVDRVLADYSAACEGSAGARRRHNLIGRLRAPRAPVKPHLIPCSCRKTSLFLSKNIALLAINSPVDFIRQPARVRL